MQGQGSCFLAPKRSAAYAAKQKTDRLPCIFFVGQGGWLHEAAVAYFLCYHSRAPARNMPHGCYNKPVSYHKHLHTKKRKDPFDYVMYFFMVATPLFELPQAIAIYTSHSAKGVSVWTWSFFFMSSLVWITYTLRNKLYPLLVTYSLFVTIEASVVIGIVLYQ